MEIFESVEFIPCLPSEIGLECLIRLPPSFHRVASSVCKQWRKLFLAPEFYNYRKRVGNTRKVLCLLQSLPSEDDLVIPEGTKQHCETPCFGVSVFDPIQMVWERVDPIQDYPNGLPLFCQACGVGSKLVIMGGWDPERYDPVTSVYVYDFSIGRWKKGRDMPGKRSFFAMGGESGNIYVSGGHDEEKNALSSAWKYDVGNDEWTVLGSMSCGRDECEGVFLNGEFWVVSGYDTENQGLFKSSAEVYNLNLGLWRSVEGVWMQGKCPRSSVCVGKCGVFFHWGDVGLATCRGARGINVGTHTLVCGSEYQAAKQGLFLTDNADSGRFEKLNVSHEFSGFVQSGCCVEI